MAALNRKLTRIAFVCMIPEVDSHEHRGVELPSYCTHRILAAVVADPELSDAESRLFDLERDDADAYVDALTAFEPQLIGLSLFVGSAKCLIEVARRMKKRFPDCTIVFGGPSARPAVPDLAPYRKAIDYVDAVVTRDGEQAICDIARAIQDASATVDRHTTLSAIVGLELSTPLGWKNTGFRLRLKDLDVIASPHQMGLMHYGAV